MFINEEEDKFVPEYYFPFQVKISQYGQEIIFSHARDTNYHKENKSHYKNVMQMDSSYLKTNISSTYNLV